MDLSDTIAPRSDQLNAEDMLSGPRTVAIVEVRKGASPEQPVDIVLAEFGPGRPFKPSKTVRRILVAAWGPDASTYAGRRMTLYRDASVRFGGMDVGGIRVSHLSHIDKPLTLALTVTRGKRAAHTVQPLPHAPAVQATETPSNAITAQQLSDLGAALRAAGLTDRAAGLAYIGDVVGREVDGTKALTTDEADRVLAQLKAELEARE